jgi:hypothetical protein
MFIKPFTAIAQNPTETILTYFDGYVKPKPKQPFHTLIKTTHSPWVVFINWFPLPSN